MAGLPDPRALLDLSGKAALVTGAAEGIGAEIARHLAGAGARVALLDRNADRLAETARELTDAGAEVIVTVADLSDGAQINAAFDKAVATFGGLDILVNNAGIHDRAHLLETSDELWDKIHTINAKGAFRCLRAASQAMVAGGRGGRIVNISSIGSLHPMLSGLAAYAGSKGAVNALTRNAAFELAPHDILVNAVMPGGVMTPGAAGAVGPAVSGRVLDPPLLGRIAAAADIAAMVLFLVSPAAGAITGQQFVVDAGFLVS